MKRFLLPPFTGRSLTLSGKDFHYLVNVRRLAAGDRFAAMDKNGDGFTALIRGIGKKTLSVDLSPEKAGQSALVVELPELTLFQCVPKHPKLEQIVRQAVEAGVKTIIPVHSSFCVARLAEPKKIERLRNLAVQAQQQSGNLGPCRVLEAISLSELPSVWGAAGPLFFMDEDALASGSLSRYLEGRSSPLAVLVGPEGGLSAPEKKFLLESGAHGVHFPCPILRTETAALYGVAALSALWWQANQIFMENANLGTN